jgi:coenzyme F420-0:L-glutamate ligase/coenzyme F420-1:gamma-L-glutamate ligase
MLMKRFEVLGLQSVPEIEAGDDLAEIILNCANNETDGIKDRDIIVLTSKIVPKALGLTKKLSDIKPGKKALVISRKTGKDPKWLQMIFDAGHEILAIIPLKGFLKEHIMSASEDLEASDKLCEHEQAVVVTLSKEGRIHTCDAGIDGSNHPAGIVSFMPANPDDVASNIRQKIQQATGKTIAVILADTEMIPFGTMDFAVGSSGIEPISRQFGQKDNFGKPKFGGIDLTVHEMCSACGLVFGQTNAGVPVAIIRGFEYQVNETANVANTMLPNGHSKDLNKAIRATLRATSHTRPFLQRTMLQIVSRIA